MSHTPSGLFAAVVIGLLIPATSALGQSPIALPQSQTVDVDGTVLSLTNSGDGTVVELHGIDPDTREPTFLVFSDTVGTAIRGRSTKSGIAIEGVTTGLGVAGTFRNDNPDNLSPAVEIATASAGPALSVSGGVTVNGELEVNGRAVPMVPVGAIVPFFGDPAQLPAGWVVCDGQVITAEGSPLNGMAAPDLREMFLRGAANSGDVGSTGGNDFTPSHSHYFSGSTDQVWFGIASGNGNVGSYSPNKQANGGAWDQSQLIIAKEPKDAANPYRSHGHMNGTAYIGGGTGAGGASDNRPRFMSVFFILRVI